MLARWIARATGGDKYRIKATADAISIVCYRYGDPPSGPGTLAFIEALMSNLSGIAGRLREREQGQMRLRVFR